MNFTHRDDVKFMVRSSTSDLTVQSTLKTPNTLILKTFVTVMMNNNLPVNLIHFI